MALDPKKKFLYFNKDATSGEMDAALCFPVSRLAGIMIKTSTFMDFHFDGSKGTDATIVRVTHEQHAFQKAFMIAITDEINFGEKAFIRVIDQAERSTLASDVTINMLTDVVPTFTIQDTNLIISDEVSIGGHAVNDIDVASEFVDSDEHLMTSAAINDRFAQINASTTGNAATATALASAVTIGGVSFDGTSNIDLPGVSETGDQSTSGTAAGLSSTLVVGSGGTGATTLTSNAVLTGNGSSAIQAESALTYDADTDTLQLTSSSGGFPRVELKSEANTSSGQRLVFIKDRGAAPSDGDTLGIIRWEGEDSGQNATSYAQIFGKISDTTDGSEGGHLALQVASHDGEMTVGLELIDGDAEDEIDVNIGSGASSVTTIEGTLTMGSTAAMTNAGLLSVANQSNITGVGTISSGVWQGTAIASANLDADTAHLTTDQTFTGKKQINIRKFAVTSDTDGNAIGDVVYFGGTTSMTTGALYHYKSDSTWELADADAVATCDGLLGIALGAASDTNGVLLRGMVTVDHDTGAVGDVLFVSTTAGDITATAPSGNTDIVRVVGYCLHASNGQIWFNPDGAFVEVTA